MWSDLFDECCVCVQRSVLRVQRPAQTSDRQATSLGAMGLSLRRRGVGDADSLCRSDRGRLANVSMKLSHGGFSMGSWGLRSHFSPEPQLHNLVLDCFRLAKMQYDAQISTSNFQNFSCVFLCFMFVPYCY